jgi:hypothetical protein
VPDQVKSSGPGLREKLRVGRMRGSDVCGSVRIGERGTAGSAAVSLHFSLAVGSKPLAGLVFASDACHGVSPLAFCGETSQNTLGSEAWVTPRFGLAPTPVQAEAGALTQRIKLVAAASSPPICDGSACARWAVRI